MILAPTAISRNFPIRMCGQSGPPLSAISGWTKISPPFPAPTRRSANLPLSDLGRATRALNRVVQGALHLASSSASKQHATMIQEIGWQLRSSLSLQSFFVGLLVLVGAGCAPTDLDHSPGRENFSRAANGGTALDRYVAAPDTNYGIHVVRSIPGRGMTSHLLEMTSQVWLTTNEVERPLWKHWIYLVKPEEVASSNALLFIAGGSNDGKEPKGIDEKLAQIAKTTKS